MPWRTSVSASPPAGNGVGDQTVAVSSSRRYRASAGVSKTGSFRHGVSLFSPALSDQVEPSDDSLTMQPNVGLARTLHHGAGVGLPGRTETTYSRPSSANPPMPLSKR